MWTRLTDPMVRADAIGLGLQTGIGVSRAVGTGRLWLELRYGHGLSAQRGSAFMPLIIGASF
jgi:hypothetical protein